MTADTKLSIGDALRKVADSLDEHPELASWIDYTSFGRHFKGAAAAHVDDFAAVFGVPVVHHEHTATESDPATSYTVAEAYIGQVRVAVQAYTADYEAATGKTIKSGKDTPK